uniref:Uncharacterized protein n=1 Tax=Arundo donax TaxID=35708 RepID=A0A0A9BKI7_ARUDO
MIWSLLGAYLMQRK